MSGQAGKIDSPVCRQDLVKKAAASTFQSDFDWLDDRVANRVEIAGENRGLRAVDIREIAREYILDGGEIICTREQRELYRDRRHFHYDIVIGRMPYFPDDFPYGFYVEMELNNPDEQEPTVKLLNAHPERGC